MTKSKNSEKTVEQLVLDFQGGADTFNDIVDRFEGMVISKAKSIVFGHDFDDVKQELLIELHKCCLNYNGTGKLSTMFVTYADRRLYAMRQLSDCNNRKANFMADSYQQMVDNGYDLAFTSDEYSNIEASILLDSLNLTANEEKFCRLIMSNECESKKEIASMIGVDPSSISYFRDRVRAKMLQVACL